MSFSKLLSVAALCFATSLFPSCGRDSDADAAEPLPCAPVETVAPEPVAAPAPCAPVEPIAPKSVAAPTCVAVVPFETLAASATVVAAPVRTRVERVRVRAVSSCRRGCCLARWRNRRQTARARVSIDSVGSVCAPVCAGGSCSASACVGGVCPID